jgi:hypothetical protein
MTGEFRRYYNPQWFPESIPTAPYDALLLRKAFEKVRSGYLLVLSGVWITEFTCLYYWV